MPPLSLLSLQGLGQPAWIETLLTFLRWEREGGIVLPFGRGVRDGHLDGKKRQGRLRERCAQDNGVRGGVSREGAGLNACFGSLQVRAAHDAVAFDRFVAQARGRARGVCR
jgi:hypothetical protein